MGRGKYPVARVASLSLLVLSTLLAISVVPVMGVRAEGLSGYLEYDYTRNDTQSRVPSGQSIRTKFDSITQLYNLTLDRRLYPNLNLLASGLFQRRDSSFDIEGRETDGTTTNLRPYVNLNLRTRLYYAEIVYARNEEKVENKGAPTIDTIRESFLSTLYWKPDRFPDLKIQYFKDHLYDKDRLRSDDITDVFQATSNYQPNANLTLYYQGTYRNTELRLSDTTTKETINNGRVNYSNQWMRRRITFGLDYNITNQQFETTTSGSGEVALRVLPFAGLSASSDTPENVVLASNPALIDGDLTAGTGIDLGLPVPGGDTRQRNMGLDFILATEINTLYVWVDRDVEQVANAFSWGIYTSDDDPSDGVQIWALRQTVSPAIYSPTFKRFEIRFANVTARYVKVVTAPLTPVVPFASAYPTILVTELQGEIRKPASEVAGKQESTFQNGNLNFRALLMETINLAYEFTYAFTKSDPGDLRYTVSNGLSFLRQFNNVFSGTGRIAYEIGEEKAGHREALLYTASLTAVPVQTLFHSLTFSGREETIAGKKDSNVSILLYNVAKLYEGIDANLSGGVSFQEFSTGRKSRSTQMNTGATFVPNRKVTLTLLYIGDTTVSSGGEFAGERTTYTRSGEADLMITPVQTVYLFGSYRIEHSTASPNRNILNYSLSWSPFPDGTLHLTFYYNEIIRSDESKERSISPSLRWYFTPRSYLDLSYQNLKTETIAIATTANVYSGTVRISF